MPKICGRKVTSLTSFLFLYLMLIAIVRRLAWRYCYLMVMKDRKIAAVLAFFLGGLGVHKFYLGQIIWGVVYLIFCWTGIPTLISFIEGVVLLFESDESFHNRVSK